MGVLFPKQSQELYFVLRTEMQLLEKAADDAHMGQIQDVPVTEDLQTFRCKNKDLADMKEI